MVSGWEHPRAGDPGHGDGSGLRQGHSCPLHAAKVGQIPAQPQVQLTES